MISLRSRPRFRRLLGAAVIPLLSLLFVSCPSEVWIPVGGVQRAAVAKGQVVFLEYPPTRPHEVIGIITPPAGEYETEAEAVKAMLKIAAKYGADAIYMESQSESGGWKFGTVGGLSGGSFSELRFRAKAIVWK
jgi:hypothetical protein